MTVRNQLESLSAIKGIRIIDIYPVHKRWHDLRTEQRGTYDELVSFIKSINMNSDLEKELADAAGETDWRRIMPLELNEVSLNGSGSMSKREDGQMGPAGGFFRKRILTGNRNRNENGTR
jgi:hypothetical protein